MSDLTQPTAAFLAAAFGDPASTLLPVDAYMHIWQARNLYPNRLRGARVSYRRPSVIYIDTIQRIFRLRTSRSRALARSRRNNAHPRITRPGRKQPSRRRSL